MQRNVWSQRYCMREAEFIFTVNEDTMKQLLLPDFALLLLSLAPFGCREAWEIMCE